MMAAGDDDQRRLRSAALQNSGAILAARERAERELVQAKEELERKTRELAQSLAMLRATLEATTDGILVTDVSGRVTGSNAKLAEIWQLPAPLRETTHQQFQEAIGRQLTDGRRNEAMLQEIYETWPPESFDLLELADGRAIERRSKVQTVEGQPSGRVWSYRNISERRGTEEKIRQQRAWFEVTLSSIGDAVITTDVAARVTYLNPVAEEMTGWKLAEAFGQPLEKVFQIVNERTGASAPNPIAKALADGVVVGLANHTALIARDGRSTAIEDSAAPIRDPAGAVCGAVMVFHDVTARRRAENLLRESEQRFRATFNQAAVGMATARPDGRFEQVNRRFCEILGYAEEDLCQRTFLELTFADDVPRTTAEMQHLVTGETTEYSLEKRYVRKDARLVWSLTTVTVVRDAENKIVRFIGVIEDITPRRHAEAALQARERELSLIYHNVSDIIFSLRAEADGRWRFVSVNRAFCAATGLKESEVVGQFVETALPEPARARALAHCEEAIRDKKSVRWEESVDAASGRKTGLVSVTPIFDDSGKCINVIGTVHDVSERRQTEELRARLAAVVESSDDAIVSKTLEGIVTTWNRGAERLFGFSPEEMVGKPIALLFPPDRADEEPSILRRIRQGERVDHYQTIRVRKDGTPVAVSVTISPVRDRDGVIIGASKIARDITAQKKFEATLRDSEERYRLLGHIVPHLLWMTDAEGRPTYFNERWYAYTGDQEAQAFSPHRVSLLHVDDQPGVVEAWKRAVQDGSPFEAEYRLRRHDGAYRWFVARGVPLRDEAGKILRWYGSSTDIHDQKATTEALREQYLVTEQLNDVARALATELDPARIVQIITDVGTRITRAQFGAFFHNHVDDAGESYTLYTLSGAPREAFETFPMPRATAIFGPTFRGEGVIRLDDVRQDPRFGKNPPHHGMPAGHLPVVSYLAVSVVSRSGAVIGGLFFGHAEKGMFIERDEKIAVGIAAQAAAALDNARLYQAEQQARAAAERANKAKDDFLATLSHELRNPLNPVLLIASESAQDASLSAETRADFEMIQRNVELEARLIDDLLDLTRITRRKMSLELRPTKVDDVLLEAVAIVRRDAENKGIMISTNFLAEKNRVMADPARLQQVFWNVLRNAVKFTPQGGRVTIQARNVAAREEIEVEVTDTGIGMTAAEITRIFEAFMQGDHASSTGSHRFGGLGLGLAIAQYLVQMHGGRIAAESAGLQQGATFRIALPLLDRLEPDEKP